MGESQMSVALELYHGLTEAGEDKKKAKLFADAFEHLERRYPEVKDLATNGQLTEHSLQIKKDIAEINQQISKDIAATNLQASNNVAEINLQASNNVAEINLQAANNVAKINQKAASNLAETNLTIEKMRSALAEKMNRHMWLQLGALSLATSTIIGFATFLAKSS